MPEDQTQWTLSFNIDEVTVLNASLQVFKSDLENSKQNILAIIKQQSELGNHDMQEAYTEELAMVNNLENILKGLAEKLPEIPQDEQPTEI